MPGHNPLNSCNRSTFESYAGSDALIILTGILSGMSPMVNLIFIISIQDLKNKCQVLCVKINALSTINTKITAGSIVESREMF